MGGGKKKQTNEDIWNSSGKEGFHLTVECILPVYSTPLKLAQIIQNTFAFALLAAREQKKENAGIIWAH